MKTNKHVFLTLVLLVLLAACGGPAESAVLIKQPSGALTAKAGGLAAAVTSADAAGKEVLFTTDQYLTGNMAVPAGVTLTPVNGAQIKNSTYTVSYPGSTSHWPKNAQVFDGTGAVTGLNESWPEMFQTNTTPGTTNMAVGIARAQVASKCLLLPGVAYGTTVPIQNLTSDALGNLTTRNGIQVLGRAGTTTIRALTGFPASTAVINLDGNINNETIADNAVAQNYDVLKDLEIDCNNIADRGIRLRAVRHCSIEDVVIKGAAGGVNDAAIYIAGTSTAGQDDADTTAHLTVKRLKIRGSTGWGVIGTSNRSSSVRFEDCDIRDCDYDGMRMSFAGLTLVNCTFAGNGSVISAATGGFSAVAAATGAVNRGLVIQGCQFENNYNHEILIEKCSGFNIIGGLLTPFVNAAASQAVIKLGTTTESVEGGFITGVRVAVYSTAGTVISGMVVGGSARNISFDNISFDTSGSTWDTFSEQFTVSSNAAAISHNGKSISNYPQTAAFTTSAVTFAEAFPDVTGDGVEYTLASFAGYATTNVTGNSGPQRQVHTIVAASIAGTTMTVTSISGTPLQQGNMIIGTGIAPNTFITGLGTGVGGTGTYIVSVSQTVASSGMRAFDSQWYSRTAGVFTAPSTGFYEFAIAWPCTGFAGTETDVEAALIVNPSGTPVRHLVEKRTVASLGATAIYTYGGSKIIYLTAGDNVTGSIKISGGTKVVDIYRNLTAPGGFIFSGRAI